MATRAVHGMEDVVRALSEVPKEARALLRNVVSDSTRIITQRTKQAAPFDTGALREAITGVPPKGRSLTGNVTVQPGEFRGRVPSAYVLAVEYGKGAGARPFIRSTAEAESIPFANRVKAAGKTLETNLKDIGGRNL